MYFVLAPPFLHYLHSYEITDLPLGQALPLLTCISIYNPQLTKSKAILTKNGRANIPPKFIVMALLLKCIITSTFSVLQMIPKRQSCSSPVYQNHTKTPCNLHHDCQCSMPHMHDTFRPDQSLSGLIKPGISIHLGCVCL